MDAATHTPPADTLRGIRGASNTQHERGHTMATQSERITALESSISSIADMLGTLVNATSNTATDTADTGVESVSDTDTDTPPPTQRNGVKKGRKYHAVVAPEGKTSTRQPKDPNSRCTLDQAKYAASTVRDNEGLTQRTTDGTVWFSGIRRDIDPDSDTEKKYAEHIEQATRHLLSAFNLYAEKADQVNVNTATYGTLWEWLDANAPVSLQKAKREQDARLDAKGK